MRIDDEMREDDPMMVRIGKQLQAPVSVDAEAFDARVMAEVRAMHQAAAFAARPSTSSHTLSHTSPQPPSHPSSRRMWIGVAATFLIGTGLGWFAHGHLAVPGSQTSNGSANSATSMLPASPVSPVVASGAPVSTAMSRAATIRFRLSAALGGDARHVTLAGSFNGWNPMTIPLRRQRDGSWVADVPLAAGRYVYQFVIDGVHWIPDPSAPSDGDHDFGTPNSVITVASGV